MSAMSLVEFKDGDGSDIDTTCLESISIRFIQNGYVVTLLYSDYDEEYAFVTHTLAIDFIDSILVDMEA